MRKILFIAVCLLLLRSSSAQTYFPFPLSDAFWTVIRCWYFYQPGWYDLFTYEQSGDTIINNITYHQLYITTHHLPGTLYDTLYTQYFGAIREDQQKIYVISNYATGDNQERILYDFNAQQPGDTLTTHLLSYGDPIVVKNIVWQIDSILVDGQYHRSLRLTNIDGTPTGERWTEGIGSNFGLAYASFHVVTDNSYDLRCFSTEDIEYQNDQLILGYCIGLPEIPCDFATAIQPFKPLIEITIYPNPASDQLTLYITGQIESEARLTIVNSIGQVLIENKIAEIPGLILNVSQFAPGLYWLQLINETDDEKVIPFIIE